MNIKFFDIVWDTDGVSSKKLGLPEKAELTVADDFHVEMDGADALSDKFGFCVHSFNYE